MMKSYVPNIENNKRVFIILLATMFVFLALPNSTAYAKDMTVKIDSYSTIKLPDFTYDKEYDIYSHIISGIYLGIRAEKKVEEKELSKKLISAGLDPSKIEIGKNTFLWDVGTLNKDAYLFTFCTNSPSHTLFFYFTVPLYIDTKDAGGFVRYVLEGLTIKTETTSPKLNKTSATIKNDSTLQLKVKNTTEKISWQTSNKKIATVDKNGLVKAKKAGTVTISAKVGNKKLKCKITVKK